MKNCEVTIIQKHSNGTVQTKYEFDDYRVAQALCNLLDNVGETHDEGYYYDWNHIHKTVIDERKKENDDKYQFLKSKGGSVYGTICEKENQGI